MRVIGGVARGRPLKGPSTQATRPTSDKVKGAIFSMVEAELMRRHPEAGELWEGIRTLDLYAGSGALGIEALSRGAAWADFVDDSVASCRLIRYNLELTGLADRARVHCTQTHRALAGERGGVAGPYQLTVVDAPYGDPLVLSMLDTLGRSSLLAADALVVVEHGRRADLPAAVDRLERRQQKRYGDTLVSIYRPART
ncbi:MAG: RsmD family RNA methyltransferase [Chloroflexi bacterium]|nr:RsmD family RNA methyltransferase [Chloroflexota bacterium]